MPARKTILAIGEIYHIFNRSVESRPIFKIRRDHLRAIETIDFYRYSDWPIKLSKFRVLNIEEKQLLEKRIKSESKKMVRLLSYCLMPNHIHFLLQQIKDKGISRFMSNFTNSYTRYFNVRHRRKGHLFQSMFKAVRIETNEQLLHVSRYIHLNPVISYIINEKEINKYEWSSYPEFLGVSPFEICDPDLILSQFSSPQEFQKFVLDQVDYGKRLEAIKHLIFN